VKIPITKPEFDQEEEQAVLEVLRSGWVSQGPKVAQFEAALASYTEARHAVATTSCTSALHLLLAALGLGPGDEVLVPAFTFVATANAVEYQGAVPVFVDIDLRTFNVAVEEVEARITPRTRAIIPVHLFGLSADMDPILELGRRYRLAVIEDAACAIGSRYRDRHVGALGTAGAFSFHPRKVITTGEGGAVTTNGEDLASRVQILRNHGARLSDLERHQANAAALDEYDELGFNYRMTDVQAAIGIAQLGKVDKLIARRRFLAGRYTEALKELPGLQTPWTPEGYTHTYQSYVLLREAGAPKSRDEAAAALNRSGIAVRQGTHAVHALAYYRRKYGLKESHCPNAWIADRQSLTLPLYPSMDEATQDRVIAALRDFWR